MDDFIVVGPTASGKTEQDLNNFISMSEQCGIPIKHSKTVHATTSIVAHGIEVDSVAMEARPSATRQATPLFCTLIRVQGQTQGH